MLLAAAPLARYLRLLVYYTTHLYGKLRSLSRRTYRTAFGDRNGRRGTAETCQSFRSKSSFAAVVITFKGLPMKDAIVVEDGATRQRRAIRMGCMIAMTTSSSAARFRIGASAHKEVSISAPPWTLFLFLLGFSSQGYAQSIENGSLDKPLDIRIDAGYTYDGNVTRAPNFADKRSEQFYSLNAGKSLIFPVAASSRFVLDGSVGGEVTRFFPKLGRVFGELQGELQYRKSADFYSPTFAVFGRASAEHYGSGLRSGYRYLAGISVRQTVTDRVSVFAAVAHTRRNANSGVFDSNDNSVQVNVDYTLGAHGTLYLAGDYRVGDVVSTGSLSLVNLDVAKVFVLDDAFTNPQLISYRFDSRAVVTTLGYNFPVDSSSSFDLSWRWEHSEATHQASFPGAGTTRYSDNQFGIVYLRRF